MSDSYSRSSTLNEEEQREIPQQRFPRAGYWFNMLPTDPFIHGVKNMPPQQILPHPFCVPGTGSQSAISAVCHCFKYYYLNSAECWSH
ncbi:hypothetical protein BDR04DRAFT_1099612 [Suillus decipiens]|nr:hypothetical protein BDR04DRAFT_1099612 [Suillus decipiens]